MGFGRGPLSSPGSVEAIETLFVPYLCRNNVGGAEGKLRERFEEPAWNNPVVRVLDARGKDLVPRAERAWADAEFIEVLATALEKSGASQPAWFCELRAEHEPRASVVFGMHCFWEGQAKLGSLAGVVDVRPGFADGGEVCEVLYAPSRVELASLVRSAFEHDAAERVLVRSQADLQRVTNGRASVWKGEVRPAPESDDLRALKRDLAAWALPLTRAQRVRANAALAQEGTLAKARLSPRMHELHAQLAKLDANALRERGAPTRSDELGAHEDALRERLGARK